MNYVEEIKRESRQEGLMAGRVEGRQEGRVEGQVRTIEGLLRAGAAWQLIKSATGLTRPGCARSSSGSRLLPPATAPQTPTGGVSTFLWLRTAQELANEERRNHRAGPGGRRVDARLRASCAAES